MKRAGGTVTKGMKGWPVLLYKRVSKSAASDQDDTGYFIVRQFTVFNVVAQTTGIELPTHTAREHVPTDAELILEHSGAEFRRADRAAYVPSNDEILLPAPEAFLTADAYYSVAFHELTHWTGAPHHIGRDHSGTFGSPAYAREELIAELGAAFWCTQAGISAVTRPDHAAYLASWLRVLRTDARALVTVASKAQAAIDHLNTLTGHIAHAA